LAGVRVTGVDRIAKEVYCADGQTVAYDTLLIATGSRPFIPPLDGLATSDGGWKPGVFTFRTLDDCDNIASYATESHRVAVIGSGLLGLEAARGLLDHGCEVHVIHLGRHL
jgi:nitrite reductase (NADH) large subunit